MSKKCKCRGTRRKGSGNGLIILILILLQFGCCRGFHNECHTGRKGCCEVDNSILFIIALYYLSCCGDFSLCCC